MYGTVAKLQLKPGMEAQMQQLMDEFASVDMPGLLGEHVYRLDNEPGVYYMTVMFSDRAAYMANAAAPAQHERFLRYRALLTADPEWHDGEIIWPRG
jgi:quinol monooxygenase YgiN